MEILELNKSLVNQANSNSFNGTRGDTSEHDYKVYCNEVLSWNLSDDKKQNILNQIHKKWSEKLKYEAQHISVMYAGPARYNAKKFDKSDKILSLSADFCQWFKDLEEQYKRGQCSDDKKEHTLSLIKSIFERGYDPKDEIMSLINIDIQLFIEQFEKYYPHFKWRKNSNFYKAYEKAKSGELKTPEKKMIFEDKNFTCYIFNDRVYIKFFMRPKRQLIVALKSRKYWWNAYENAWSTYVSRLDEEWVQSISTRYKDYI